MLRPFSPGPILSALALVLASGCAPAARPAAPVPGLPPVPPAGLPAIPRAEGALAVRVEHPTPRTPLPEVDSTFIYGSVGTGAARLTINGVEVDVQPNGAFLAYLPRPDDGRWELVAEAGGQIERTVVQYRMPVAEVQPARAPTTLTYPTPRIATVTGGADTLATGSDVAIGRPAPTGTYRWFFPRGARLTVDAERGDQLRVRLAESTPAWVAANLVRLGSESPAAGAIGAVGLRPASDWVDVRVAAAGAPFLVERLDAAVALTIYGGTAPTAVPQLSGDALVLGGDWVAPAPDAARLELRLARDPWGYKAFYEADGTLVLRLRRPPPIDPAQPLRGIRIVVDPGHPPGGATGPSGLSEAEANLAIAVPLAERLRARGAEVFLTRTDHVAVPLVERVNLAIETDAHLLVSVHNNAFMEGANPFRRHGTSTYYFHPLSAGLASALQREIQATTLIPDLGALTGNFAVIRSTWLPSALTESLFMPMPEQEAALRHPDFVRNLADAHVRGIEAFLRERS